MREKYCWVVDKPWLKPTSDQAERNRCPSQIPNNVFGSHCISMRGGLLPLRMLASALNWDQRAAAVQRQKRLMN